MYYDPFDELDRMHEEMDRIFGMYFGVPDRRLIGHSGNKALAEKSQARMPVCHMQETESKMIATFELPGVDKKDINLTVDDDRIELKVEAKQENKQEDKEKGYRYFSQSSAFYRSMVFPKDVDSSKAEAEYKDGVLRVEVPKKQKDAQKKRLEIR
jgi:HSP20 family protein